MSNDLITYSTALPDFLKEAGGYRDEGMTAGIAPRAPRLSVTTSKQWTINEEGSTRILQTEITDASGRKSVVPAPYVRGVIIASSGTLTKAWYEKAYVPGTNAAPDCYSNDGRVPAPGVANQQCANCAQCPKNAFGSHPVTGRGKACGDRKLIVVALDSMPDKLATFNLPTMSLASLRTIDGQLKSSNIPLQSVMMEFSFDPSVTYPVVKIGAVGFIGKEHFEKFRAAADTDEVSQLLREVDYEAPAEVPATSVVPNNQIAFGSGAAVATAVVEPKEPELTPKQVAAAALKAQLAALEAEDEDEQVQQTTQPTNGIDLNQAGQSEQHILVSGQAGSSVSNQTPAKRTRRSKAEMEAARAQEAAQQQQTGVNVTDNHGAIPGNALQLGVSQTLALEPEVQTEAAPVTAVASTGAPNVLDLLSKWANK